MSRLLILIRKNLLRFVKNPKTIGFLIMIPVIYYILLGLIFGGINFADTTSTYTLGWIDNDSSESSQENLKLTTFYDIFQDDIDVINLVEYNSTDDAQIGIESGVIIGYVIFEQGFEENLQNKSKISLAFYNNDTTTSLMYNVNTFFLTFNNSFSDILKISNITSQGEATNLLQNFNQSHYDSMLVINEGFFEGLDNSWNVNMTYHYRNSTTTSKTISKNAYVKGIISSFADNSFQASGSNITIECKNIPNTSAFSPIAYDIAFRGDISLATSATITNTINQVIIGVINYDPGEIDLEVNQKSVSGENVNNITFSAPGYLLYGPMTILSFVLVVLTGEKKDGIFKRLSSTQVKNWELILSNIFSSIILVFMQFGIGALILSFFGWNPVFATILDLILGLIITIFLFSFFLLALAFALAPVFKDPDSAGGGVWIIIIPLAMVSGIFVPIELFGETMKIIASVLPTRFAVIALQNLLLNGKSILYPETLLNLGLLTLYSVIIFIIGIKFFKKFISTE